MLRLLFAKRKREIKLKKEKALKKLVKESALIARDGKMRRIKSK